MRIDAYTKVVLTIIAICLVWMCVSGAVVTPVAAQNPRPQEVMLVGSRTPIAVVTAPRTSLVVRPGVEWYQDALPVDAPQPLSARLVGVEKAPTGRWDALDVNVKDQPRKAAPGH